MFIVIVNFNELLPMTGEDEGEEDFGVRERSMSMYRVQAVASSAQRSLGCSELETTKQPPVVFVNGSRASCEVRRAIP